MNRFADVASGTLIPMPELLPDDELVSTLPSSLHRFADVLLSLSLSMHGVNGWENVIGVVVPLVFEDSNGQMDASSSGRNVDTDGDSINVRGNSTSSNAGSVDMPMVFMTIPLRVGGDETSSCVFGIVFCFQMIIWKMQQ